MRKKKTGLKIKLIMPLALILLIAGGVVVYISILPSLDKTRAFRKVSSALKTHSRKADILITEVVFDEVAKKLRTGSRFIEYNAGGKPLEPKTFYFDGNVIQVQSLMIRFNGLDMEIADYFKGKNAYLFWKAFLPDSKRIKQVELTGINMVPKAYKVRVVPEADEEKIWKTLWNYALDSKNADTMVIKNVKIKAPGVIFIPGTVYSLKIKSDGSLEVKTSR